MSWFVYFLVGGALILTAVFIILLVLIQRGKGGGLSGALGGMGGNSALGTKAGDTFTWITYCAATFWCLLSLLAIKLLNQSMVDYASDGFRKKQEENMTKKAAAGDTTKNPAKASDTKTEVKTEKSTESKGVEKTETKTPAETKTPVETKTPAETKTPVETKTEEKKEAPAETKVEPKTEESKANPDK